MKFTIVPKSPFDFDLLWKFYAWEKPSPEIYENGVWGRALRLDGKLFPVKIKSIGTTERPRLETEIFSEINKTETRKLKEKIGWIFNSHHIWI